MDEITKPKVWESRVVGKAYMTTICLSFMVEAISSLSDYSRVWAMVCGEGSDLFLEDQWVGSDS